MSIEPNPAVQSQATAATTDAPRLAAAVVDDDFPLDPALRSQDVQATKGRSTIPFPASSSTTASARDYYGDTLPARDRYRGWGLSSQNGKYADLPRRDSGRRDSAARAGLRSTEDLVNLESMKNTAITILGGIHKKLQHPEQIDVADIDDEVNPGWLEELLQSRKPPIKSGKANTSPRKEIEENVES